MKRENEKNAPGVVRMQAAKKKAAEYGSRQTLTRTGGGVEPTLRKKEKKENQ